MQSPRRKSRFLLPIGVAALVVTIYLFGILVGHKGMFPTQQLRGIGTQMRTLITGEQKSRQHPASQIKWTIFLPLQVDEVEVPRDREGAGGGLTSVEEELLLLTHDGRIFVISGMEILRSEIATPDNGFDEYQAAAEGRFRHLTNDVPMLRYNDILYYAKEDAAGLVISYTEWIDERDCYGTTIGHLQLPEQLDSVSDLSVSADDWEVIYRTQPCLPLKDAYRALEGHMAGGRMAFLQPNKLILGSGDYHWDGMRAPVAYAQDPSTDYGKILEIDIDSKSARRVSIGNRNVQGILVDKAGQIWAVEHGPRGGDELNKILDGGNYGWPLSTLGTRYNKLPIPSAKTYGRHDPFDPPVYAWVPSVAISNITEIQGFDPSWDGDLLAASLAAKTLFRLRLRNDRVVFAEPIKLHRRIRYVHQHTDGRIVLWTDSGTLIFIRKSNVNPVSHFINKVINEMEVVDERKDNLRFIIDQCAECHAFSSDEENSAPGLGDIFGRPIASSDYSGYSESLRSKPGNWTAQQLRMFLDAPNVYASGTTMPDPNLSSESITDLIYVLRSLALPLEKEHTGRN